MKSISLITLLLAIILFIMSAYANAQIFGVISLFGVIVGSCVFIDAVATEKKSKKTF